MNRKSAQLRARRRKKEQTEPPPLLCPGTDKANDDIKNLPKRRKVRTKAITSGAASGDYTAVVPGREERSLWSLFSLPLANIRYFSRFMIGFYGLLYLSLFFFPDTKGHSFIMCLFFLLFVIPPPSPPPPPPRRKAPTTLWDSWNIPTTPDLKKGTLSP